MYTFGLWCTLICSELDCAALLAYVIMYSLLAINYIQFYSFIRRYSI